MSQNPADEYQVVRRRPIHARPMGNGTCTDATLETRVYPSRPGNEAYQDVVTEETVVPCPGASTAGPYRPPSPNEAITFAAEIQETTEGGLPRRVLTISLVRNGRACTMDDLDMAPGGGMASMVVRPGSPCALIGNLVLQTSDDSLSGHLAGSPTVQIPLADVVRLGAVTAEVGFEGRPLGSLDLRPFVETEQAHWGREREERVAALAAQMTREQERRQRDADISRNPRFPGEEPDVSARRCHEAAEIARAVTAAGGFARYETWSDEEGALNDPPIFTGGWTVVEPTAQPAWRRLVDRHAPGTEFSLAENLARHLLCADSNLASVVINSDQTGSGHSYGRNYGQWTRSESFRPRPRAAP